MSHLERNAAPDPRRAGPALAVAVAVVLLGLACVTTGVNRGDFNLVSVEEEWELGEQLEDDLAKRLDLVGDRRAVGYVNQVGRRLAAQSELAERPWEFHVVADQTLNAFNVPGGHVYAHTGLIVAADDVAAFAGVMAHEVAHGVARHGTEQLTRAYGFNVLAAVVLGESPSLAERIVAQIAGGGAFAKFSRDAEREADRLGVRYMYDAGYDPEGMARMFETLLENRRQRPNAVERFFASHPLTEARIQEVRRAAAELPPRRGLVSEDGGFRDLQSRAARHNPEE